MLTRAYWKVITSRQEHLSPLAELISKLCLSFILTSALRTYIFSAGSVIPSILFVLMVAAAISKSFSKMSSRISSSATSSSATPTPTSSSIASASSSSGAGITTPLASSDSRTSLLSSFYAHATGSFYAAASAATSSDRMSLLNAIAGMDAYKERTMSLVRRRYALFSKMPFHHRQIASETGYLDRIQALEPKVLANAKILADMSRFAKEFYNVKPAEMRVAKPTSNVQIIELLHHFVRDWSLDLQAQRAELFKPILSALHSEFPLKSITSIPSNNSKNIPSNNIPVPRARRRVLVPGSGLARLAYEISCMGFQTEALEYSSLMDIAANFIFHVPETTNSASFLLHPYIHDFSHQVSGASQARPVTIPDTTLYFDEDPQSPYNHPNQVPLTQPPTLKIGYGDFTNLVNNIKQQRSISSASNVDDDPYPDQYDAVVTLFLIDTAENALKYLESIRALLKPGGVWINYGPLKWGTSPQVEFTLEELEIVIAKLGFDVESRFQGTNEYNGDSQSLWQGKYKIRGWVARKPY